MATFQDIIGCNVRIATSSTCGIISETISSNLFFYSSLLFVETRFCISSFRIKKSV